MTYLLVKGFRLDAVVSRDLRLHEPNQSRRSLPVSVVTASPPTRTRAGRPRSTQSSTVRRPGRPSPSPCSAMKRITSPSPARCPACRSQTGSAAWTEPVTGSSATPRCGAKKREWVFELGSTPSRATAQMPRSFPAAAVRESAPRSGASRRNGASAGIGTRRSPSLVRAGGAHPPSVAMSRVESSSASRTTPAGLPLNGRAVKASTWTTGTERGISDGDPAPEARRVGGERAVGPDGEGRAGQDAAHRRPGELDAPLRREELGGGGEHLERAEPDQERPRAGEPHADLGTRDLERVTPRDLVVVQGQP